MYRRDFEAPTQKVFKQEQTRLIVIPPNITCFWMFGRGDFQGRPPEFLDLVRMRNHRRPVRNGCHFMVVGEGSMRVWEQTRRFVRGVRSESPELTRRQHGMQSACPISTNGDFRQDADSNDSFTEYDQSAVGVWCLGLFGEVYFLYESRIQAIVYSRKRHQSELAHIRSYELNTVWIT